MFDTKSSHTTTHTMLLPRPIKAVDKAAGPIHQEAVTTKLQVATHDDEESNNRESDKKNKETGPSLSQCYYQFD